MISARSLASAVQAKRSLQRHAREFKISQSIEDFVAGEFIGKAKAIWI